MCQHGLPHLGAYAIVIDARQRLQIDALQQLAVQGELQLLVFGLELRSGWPRSAHRRCSQARFERHRGTGGRHFASLLPGKDFHFLDGPANHDHAGRVPPQVEAPRQAPRSQAPRPPGSRVPATRPALGEASAQRRDGFGRRRAVKFVQPAAVRGDLRLVGGIAQHQLDMTFGVGQGQRLRLRRSHQQRHHRRHDRLALAVRLDRLPGGEYGDVLQHGLRFRIRARLGGLPVTSTSTRMPGSTKPATPTTSLTRTETARIPGGINGPSPIPLPFTARRASTTGSSACMALITGRSSTSSKREKPPAGNRLSGTPRSLTESRSSVLPTPSVPGGHHHLLLGGGARAGARPAGQPVKRPGHQQRPGQTHPDITNTNRRSKLHHRTSSEQTDPRSQNNRRRIRNGSRPRTPTAACRPRRGRRLRPRTEPPAKSRLDPDNAP